MRRTFKLVDGGVVVTWLLREAASRSGRAQTYCKWRWEDQAHLGSADTEASGGGSLSH